MVEFNSSLSIQLNVIWLNLSLIDSNSNVFEFLIKKNNFETIYFFFETIFIFPNKKLLYRKKSSLD